MHLTLTLTLEAARHVQRSRNQDVFTTPDPGVRSSVSAAEVAWAKDAKATAKLLYEYLGYG